MKQKWIQIADKLKNSKVKNIILMLALSYFMYKTVYDLALVDSVGYQTLQSIYSSKALLYFALCMFILQKVKLFNIPSLVATVLYWPLAIWFISTRITSPDLVSSDKPMLTALWILLLIVIDMIHTHRHNDLKQFYWLPFGMFLASALLRAYVVAHEYSSTAFLFFTVFFFIKIDSKEWERFIKCLVTGVFLSFAAIGYHSLTENTMDVGRWSGCLLNITMFGIYLSFVFATSVFSLVYLRNKRRRLSVEYFASWAVLLADIAFSVMCGCRIMIVADVVVILFFMTFALTPQNNHKRIIIRLLISVGILILLTVGLIAYGEYCANMPKEEYIEYLNNHGASENGNIRLSAYMMYLCRKAFTAEPIATNFQHKWLLALDALSSQRISIWHIFLSNTSFYTGGVGYTLDSGYYAGNAHNTLIQYLYEYGYGIGLVACISFLTCWIGSIIKWFKIQKDELLINVFWGIALIVVMTTECLYIGFPPMFVFYILLARIIVKSDDELSERVTKKIE